MYSIAAKALYFAKGVTVSHCVRTYVNKSVVAPKYMHYMRVAVAASHT